MMSRGWLGGGEQPVVVDAGKEQSSRSQRMAGEIGGRGGRRQDDNGPGRLGCRSVNMRIMKTVVYRKIR